MNAQTKVQAAEPTLIPINLSAIMRAENIVGVHWDRDLDRFTVHLLDHSCGGGATVGEALVKAKAMSARR